MATQVHINGLGIGEMIAAAVKEANRAQDHGYDIRRQILANAHWLWKVARSYDAANKDPEAEPGPPSLLVPLTVVVNNVEAVFGAEVRLQQARDNRHIHQAAFLSSKAASSVNEALQKLLRTTTELMGGERPDGQYTWRAELARGGFVVVEGGMMYFAIGECDECAENVWT
ncbi:hypothetical protein LTR27_008359 [Elasticomyces elasticus]|nr:hypothetical protein LTR27_008359 [Elasticomyces elasticus]